MNKERDNNYYTLRDKSMQIQTLVHYQCIKSLYTINLYSETAIIWIGFLY